MIAGMAKKYLMIFTLCISLKANSQQNDVLAVQHVIEVFFKAFSEGNYQYIDKSSVPNFLLLEQGVVWNLDTLRHKLSSPRPAGYSRINRFDFFETRINKKMAWVGYHNYADIITTSGTRKIHWLESAVLVKKNKSWRLEMMHSTVVR